MTWLWQDGHLTWAVVLTVVWLTLLLVAGDYAWRTVRMPVARLAALLAAAAVAGGAAIVWAV